MTTPTILSESEIQDILDAEGVSRDGVRAVEQAVLEKLGNVKQRDYWANECRTAFGNHAAAWARKDMADLKQEEKRFNESLNALTALPPVPVQDDTWVAIMMTLDAVKPGWQTVSSMETNQDAAIRTIRELVAMANNPSVQIKNGFASHPMTAIYDLLDQLTPDWLDDDDKTVQTACNTIRDLARRANAKIPSKAMLPPDMLNAWNVISAVLDGAVPGWSKDKLRSPGKLAIQAVKQLAREANLKQAPATGLDHAAFDRIFAALDKAIPDWERRVIVELVATP